jgi:hypothetical protein
MASTGALRIRSAMTENGFFGLATLSALRFAALRLVIRHSFSHPGKSDAASRHSRIDATLCSGKFKGGRGWAVGLYARFIQRGNVTMPILQLR